MGERGKLVATLAREAGFCFCREAAACLHALQRLAIGVEVQLLGSIGAHGAGARAAAGAGGGLGEHTGACGKRMQSIHKHHTAPKGAQSLLAPACTLAGFQRVQQDARQRALAPVHPHSASIYFVSNAETATQAKLSPTCGTPTHLGDRQLSRPAGRQCMLRLSQQLVSSQGRRGHSAYQGHGRHA